MRHLLWSLSLCSVVGVSALSVVASADPCPPEECGNNAAEPPQPCSFDEDCGDGMRCALTDDCGGCVGEGCDSDCAPVGYCEWGPEPEEVCYTDADCAEGYRCDASQEAPAPGEDSQDGAERPDEDPIGAPEPEPAPGVCVQAAQVGQSCYSDQECGPGLFCDFEWFLSDAQSDREQSDEAPSPGAQPDYGLCASEDEEEPEAPEEEEEPCMSEDCSLFNRGEGADAEGESDAEGCAVGAPASPASTGGLWWLGLGALALLVRRGRR